MSPYLDTALFVDMTIAVCLAMIFSRALGRFKDPS